MLKNLKTFHFLQELWFSTQLVHLESFCGIPSLILKFNHFSKPLLKPVTMEHLLMVNLAIRCSIYIPYNNITQSNGECE